MTYVLLWFLVLPRGQQQLDVPIKEFATVAECKDFAETRQGMVEMFKGDGRHKIIFKCEAKK